MESRAHTVAVNQAASSRLEVIAVRPCLVSDPMTNGQTRIRAAEKTLNTHTPGRGQRRDAQLVVRGGTAAPKLNLFVRRALPVAIAVGVLSAYGLTPSPPASHAVTSTSRVENIRA